MPVSILLKLQGTIRLGLLGVLTKEEAENWKYIKYWSILIVCVNHLLFAKKVGYILSYMIFPTLAFNYIKFK